MGEFNVYKDIEERTGGDIYIGVVGPVRTGKSTFIKRFMDLMVLPGVENEHERKRLTDELPQSAAGKTIMTTQPRFVPNEAVQLKLGDSANVRVRLVDCVGYMVDGALGTRENAAPRMVRTPWFAEDIPFEQAAELGTRKVIEEHSTIGVVVTTDGSITELPRSSYVQAEERVVNEMKELGKPFVVVLNTRQPEGEQSAKIRDELSEKYDVPVLALDVMHMGEEDIRSLLEGVLFEFPLKVVRFDIPGWMQALREEHWLMKELLEALRDSMGGMSKLRDYGALLGALDDCEGLMPPEISGIELGKGEVTYRVEPGEGLFYRVLGEECEYPIESDYHLVSIVKDLVKAKKEYDRIKNALDSVRETGYGMVPPVMSELKLAEPEMIRQGNSYGVRLRASGPSLHLMRADVTCEVSPVVGTEQQSEALMQSLLSEFETDPALIWQTNIFGKSLHDLVNEALSGKLTNLPADAQEKFRETLGRIVNEGSGGLICILL